MVIGECHDEPATVDIKRKQSVEETIDEICSRDS